MIKITHKSTIFFKNIKSQNLFLITSFCAWLNISLTESYNPRQATISFYIWNTKHFIRIIKNKMQSNLCALIYILVLLLGKVVIVFLEGNEQRKIILMKNQYAFFSQAKRVNMLSFLLMGQGKYSLIINSSHLTP